jgi:hypothetical protein
MSDTSDEHYAVPTWKGKSLLGMSKEELIGIVVTLLDECDEKDFHCQVTKFLNIFYTN